MEFTLSIYVSGGYPTEQWQDDTSFQTSTMLSVMALEILSSTPVIDGLGLK